MGFVDWFTKPLKDQPETKGKSRDIREEALAQMRAARERIGDEEIQKMAEQLRQQKPKITPQQARAQIEATDKERIAEHLRNLLKDK